MISRKPVSQAFTADDLVSAVSPSTDAATYYHPHGPDDIRSSPSPAPPSSPTATVVTAEEHYYDAPELVPGTAPRVISGSPDYGGEKLTLGYNHDPSAAPQTVVNTDPASQSQSLGSSPPYSSIDTDPKSGPQFAAPMAYMAAADAGVGVPGSTTDGGTARGDEGKRPWWKRKSILVLIGIILFIVIGLAVGLGVGLTVGRDNSSDDSGNDSGGGGSGGGGPGGGDGSEDGTGDGNQGAPG